MLKSYFESRLKLQRANSLKLSPLASSLQIHHSSTLHIAYRHFFMHKKANETPWSLFNNPTCSSMQLELARRIWALSVQNKHYKTFLGVNWSYSGHHITSRSALNPKSIPTSKVTCLDFKLLVKGTILNNYRFYVVK